MSGGTSCKCKGTQKEREKNWIIEKFKCNHSAFSGYKWTRSEYSALRCAGCGASWRTKADYVHRIYYKQQNQSS